MTALLPTRVLRALVVGDESSSNAALLRALQHNADILVVARASSIREAVLFAADTGTDVVVLDLELADGSAQEVIETIMSSCPRPILVLAPADHGSRAAVVAAALAAGAVQGHDRPTAWSAAGGAALRHAVQQVSKVHVVRHGRRAPGPVNRPTGPRGRQAPVVAVAASTGGPSALAVLLAGLAGLPAPVLVVQHMHADFTSGLLAWMVRVSALPVAAAEHGQQARPGHVYVGPAGRHLRLGANGILELAAEPTTIHRPSADQLFQSVADRAGSAGVGVVMTGMGDDGAAGLLALRLQGGRTFGQDEASCAVFGMPRAAARVGAVTDLLPLSGLAAAIHRAVSEVLA